MKYYVNIVQIYRRTLSDGQNILVFLLLSYDLYKLAHKTFYNIAKEIFINIIIL